MAKKQLVEASRIYGCSEAGSPPPLTSERTALSGRTGPPGRPGGPASFRAEIKGVCEDAPLPERDEMAGLTRPLLLSKRPICSPPL